MGGDLKIARSDERGTTMCLTLPLVRAAPDALREDPAMDAATHPIVPAPPARILVAEDAEINQLLIEALLTRNGHRVTIAIDGADAIAAFDEAERAGAPFDLILMDMQMPEVDGLEATRRLRLRGGLGASVPIVALTANAFASDAELCREAGMNEHLIKPIDSRSLLAAIARHTRPKHAAPVAGGDEVAGDRATGLSAGERGEDPAISALRGRYEDVKTGFGVELGELQRALSEAGADDDLRQRVADICHKLAGSAGTFGETELGDLAREIERLAGTAGSSDDLAIRTGELRQALTKAA